MPFNKIIEFFNPDLAVKLTDKEVVIVNVYLGPHLNHLIPKGLPEKCEGQGVNFKRGHSPGETTYKGVKAVGSYQLIEMLEGAGFNLHHVVGFEQSQKQRYVIRLVCVSQAKEQPTNDPWFWDVDGKGKINIQTIIDGFSSTFFLNDNKGNKMVSIELVAPEFCYFPHFAVMVKKGVIGIRSLPWQKDKERAKQAKLAGKIGGNSDDLTSATGSTYSI